MASKSSLPRFAAYHSSSKPVHSCVGRKVHTWKWKDDNGEWQESSRNFWALTQSYADSCNITRIIERMTIDPDSVQMRNLAYGDVSNRPEDILEHLSQEEMRQYDERNARGGQVQPQGQNTDKVGEMALQQVSQASTQDTGQESSQAGGASTKAEQGGNA